MNNELPITFLRSGKVRDMYLIPDHPNKLVIVMSDRLSTHNVVHRSLIEHKGFSLAIMTVFFAGCFADHAIPHHIVAWGRRIFDYLPKGEYPSDFHLRAFVVDAADVIPNEFIFRSRMGGSLWDKFVSKGKPNPYGISIPENARLMQLFNPPLFTPTDKSETDDPVQAERLREDHPQAVTLALKAYRVGMQEAQYAGIEVVDTKFELGYRKRDGALMLVDEWLTPDSSRYVYSSAIKMGENPRWLDKQYVRDEAEQTWGAGPRVPLEFSPEICETTSKLYEELVYRMTGRTMDAWRGTFSR